MDKHGIKSFDPEKNSTFYKNQNLWSAKRLMEHARQKGYPEFDLPLAAVNLTVEAFTVNSLKDFIFQVKRMNKCDLDYPILLDEDGQIADGYHRVAKAILEGRDTIKAIRILEMPKPDITNFDIEAPVKGVEI